LSKLSLKKKGGGTTNSMESEKTKKAQISKNLDVSKLGRAGHITIQC
jgi:hypothetical protein